MKRALKWLLPALIAAEVALVRSGRLDLREAVLVVAGIEALLVCVGVGEAVLIVRRYRRARTEGLDAWTALEEGMEVLLPRFVARLAVFELRLFSCLPRWALGRAKRYGDGFGYRRRSSMGAFVALVLLASPAEVLFFEVLIPWAWLRWAFLLVSLYAVLWMLALYASLVVLPHRLEEDGVRLHHGALARGHVPYSEITAVELGSRRSPAPGDGLKASPEGDALYLATGGKTDLTLRLDKPRSLQGALRTSEPATAIHLAVDEPNRLAAELRRRIGEAVTAGPPEPKITW